MRYKPRFRDRQQLDRLRELISRLYAAGISLEDSAVLDEILTYTAIEQGLIEPESDTQTSTSVPIIALLMHKGISKNRAVELACAEPNIRLKPDALLQRLKRNPEHLARQRALLKSSEFKWMNGETADELADYVSAIKLHSHGKPGEFEKHLKKTPAEWEQATGKKLDGLKAVFGRDGTFTVRNEKFSNEA